MIKSRVISALIQEDNRIFPAIVRYPHIMARDVTNLYVIPDPNIVVWDLWTDERTIALIDDDADLYVIYSEATE